MQAGGLRSAENGGNSPAPRTKQGRLRTVTMHCPLPWPSRLMQPPRSWVDTLHYLSTFSLWVSVNESARVRPPQARPAHAFLGPCHAMPHAIITVRHVREEWEGRGRPPAALIVYSPIVYFRCTALHHHSLFPSPRGCPLLVTALSAPPCSFAPLTIVSSQDCLGQQHSVLCLPAAPPPHGIRHHLHVRLSPRRHLDIGQVWREQPRHHPTSAGLFTGTATATSTRTSIHEHLLRRTRALAESINDRFTGNLPRLL